MYASTLPRSNWLRRASIRLAWYRHMPASSLVSKDIECWLQAYYNRQLDINSNRQNDETTMLTAEQCETFFSVQEWCRDNLLFVTVMSMKCYYGRPLSVSGRPCLYFANVLFIYFFMAALFSGPGERRFAKVLHVVDLECHWRSYYLDFSWSSWNYRVGQKVTKFGIFLDPARKLSALTPERGRIL